MCVERTKVLHVVDSLGAGGMENGVVNVAGRLRDDVDSWVGALVERGVFAERMPEPERVVGLGKANGFSLRAAWNLAKLVRRVRPHLIHTHNLGPLIYTLVARVAGGWLWGFPPVVHGEHSMLEGDELGGRRLEQRRRLFRRCAAVHTVSRGLLEALRDAGLIAKRMVAILNGVDGDRFRPAGDENREQGRLVVGIVGRLVARKRHAMLIGVFDRLAEGMPGLRLLMVGDQGPERERVACAVEESPFRERIEWVPFQKRPEDFYRRMDLLVVPSESEGLANVVLEAMASGVPVAGSLACGTPEVVEDGETGFLGAIGDADDLERLLRRVVDAGEPVRSEMGRRAREVALERFSLDAMASAYRDLYESVAGRSRV